MPGSLSASEAESYRSRGYHFPVRAFAAPEAGDLLGRLRATEARLGGPLAGRMNQKPHLLFPWAHQAVTHPGVLDAVESVLGVLQEVAAAGAPVLFSSHQLDLVERLCDDLVVIADGEIRASGPCLSSPDA